MSRIEIVRKTICHAESVEFRKESLLFFKIAEEVQTIDLSALISEITVKEGLKLH